MRKWVRLLLYPCFVLFFVLPAHADVHLAEPLWYSKDELGRPVVHLHFFWTRFCPHCQEASPFVAELDRKYDWLRVHYYELTRSQTNVDIYDGMAKSLGQEATSVPAFLYCETMRTGFAGTEPTGRQIEAELLACRSGEQARLSSPAPAESLTLPLLGEVEIARHSLPILTLLIASVDAFNPCAFFVLLFLLSLLIRSQSRARMAVIGGLFVFFSGLMYFIFMAAWLNAFVLLGSLTAITFAAGLIAALIGLVNIKDYFYFKQGFSLSIPDSVKPRLFQKMRGVVEAGRWPAMIGSTVVLAVAANSYELLCTAGFPMVYTRILTLSGLSDAQYYLYLLLYNLVYVVPLLAIVSVFTWTMGAKKLSEREGRRLKLLSGLMMLGLGIMLMIAPETLNNFLAALLLIGGALIVTGLLTWRERIASS
jgi:thiol-disulfide isomerase/thioredoxin